MAAAAAAVRASWRRVTHRQGAQGGAWRPATAASRRHEAALTVPPRRAGVWPLVAGARSARTRAPQRAVAVVAITASPGGRGRRGRCRPHPPLSLTTATGARGGGGGGGGRPPVCIRGDSGAFARGGGASDGTDMRVTTWETCRPGLVPPLPRPPVGGHWPATVRPGVSPLTPPPTQRTTCLPPASLGGHGRATGGGGVRRCGGRRHRSAATAAARGTARVASGGGRSGVGSPGVSGGLCFSMTLALPRHFGVACSEVLIALRVFFKRGGPAVPWSAIDLVQRIRIRERVVIPYLPVEACNRPVGT